MLRLTISNPSSFRTRLLVGRDSQSLCHFQRLRRASLRYAPKGENAKFSACNIPAKAAPKATQQEAHYG